MGEVYLGSYKLDDNKFLDPINIFPATNDAKVYALKYSVDLKELSKSILGEIKLEDVINYYNKVFPSIKTIIDEIINQLEYGILNKDVKLLKKYIKLGEKYLDNKTIEKLIIQAKDIDKKYEMIKEKEKEKKEKVKEEKVKEEIPSQPKKFSYIPMKRRK